MHTSPTLGTSTLHGRAGQVPASQCALNMDFLLEKEKGVFYWAFDTKELLKGDMQSRFNAYKTALDANFMQIDEVRFAEDLEPLGLSWVKLGLQDVLYDPKTKMLYTPNTNKMSKMSEETLPDGDAGDTLEEQRAQPRDKDGKFACVGEAGKTKVKALSVYQLVGNCGFWKWLFTMKKDINIYSI